MQVLQKGNGNYWLRSITNVLQQCILGEHELLSLRFRSKPGGGGGGNGVRGEHAIILIDQHEEKDDILNGAHDYSFRSKGFLCFSCSIIIRFQTEGFCLYVCLFFALSRSRGM